MRGTGRRGERGGGGGAAPATLSGQLTWYMRAGAAELPWEQAAVAAFKGQAPGVSLTLETVPNANEFDPKLTALLAGGTPPDVWTHWGQSGFGDYFARGLLADLSAFAARDKLDGSVFLPNTFDAWKRNGKLYGLSFNQRFGTFVYFNKQLFDGAGAGSIGTRLWRRSRDRRPRPAAIASAGRRNFRCSPLTVILPVQQLSSPKSARASSAWPAPISPKTPRISPWRRGEGDALQRPPHRQILDLQDRQAGVNRPTSEIVRKDAARPSC